MVVTRSIKTKTHTPPLGKCLFLTLPPELRVRIYHLLIQTDSKRRIIVEGSSISKIGSSRTSRKNIPTTFIFTCRQIKDEITMYCKLNAFTFTAMGFGPGQPRETMEICSWWLSEHVGAIKNLVICIDGNHFLWIVLEIGLSNPTLGLMRKGTSFGFPWADQESVHNFESIIFRFLAGVVAAAEQQGAEPVLTNETLKKLLTFTEQKRKDVVIESYFSQVRANSEQ